LAFFATIQCPPIDGKSIVQSHPLKRFWASTALNKRAHCQTHVKQRHALIAKPAAKLDVVVLIAIKWIALGKGSLGLARQLLKNLGVRVVCCAATLKKCTSAVCPSGSGLLPRSKHLPQLHSPR
jgi:hypothetical protein